jgi:hypothetical protein
MLLGQDSIRFVVDLMVDEEERDRVVRVEKHELVHLELVSAKTLQCFKGAILYLLARVASRRAGRLPLSLLLWVTLRNATQTSIVI